MTRWLASSILERANNNAKSACEVSLESSAWKYKTVLTCSHIDGQSHHIRVGNWKAGLMVLPAFVSPANSAYIQVATHIFHRSGSKIS